MSGLTACTDQAIIKAPKPEPIPLMTTICKGSFKDNMRVQLFSNPQQIHAANTQREPADSDRFLKSATDRMMLATVIMAIATHVLINVSFLW